MPGNEVGDRAHNFFARENLFQGQHSHAVGGYSPSDNNLWVSNQKQIGHPSFHTKAYDHPEQSEVEPRHNSLRLPVSNGFNFMQANARAEFTKDQSQSQHQNMNTCMYGHHVLQPRPNEATFLGLDRDSTQDNVNQKINMIPNPNRSNEIGAHGGLNLFGGQHQMNSQHPGLVQRVQQQQSGFSDINLQRELMLRKMQELQRQKDILRLNTSQHSSVNQASPFIRQASGNSSHGLINATPSSESSWAEISTGNTNWLQHASPAMHGSSSGLVFPPEQGQVQRSVGFVHQQVDQSLFGVPVSSSRGPLNSYPYAPTGEALTQQMPTYGNQYAGIPEQVIDHDGTLVTRQVVPGESLFGDVSGQGSDSWIKMEQIQQLTSAHQTGSEQEFQGSMDLIGLSQMAPDEPVIEASDVAASLDSDEEKILFGSDGNIWDAFGSDGNMGGGASNLLDDNNEFASGLPSIQSGSWSALMQSAVAEASGSGISLQERWTGLNFQNLEHPSARPRHPPTYEDSGKHQTPLADVNFPNALPNSIVDPEPTNTSMGSPQISGEGFTVNSSVATPNLSNMQGASHFGQFPINSHQLHYWKHVESPVRSKGTGNLRKPQGHLNKGSHVSESSFNSSDKEDLKMHEIESRSKRENSNDSYQSSSSCQVTTARLRENSSSDAGNLQALPATRQHSSYQSGRMNFGQFKFQYHPMGNLDEVVEMPYGKIKSTNTEALFLQHFQRLRGQGQGNLGHTNTSGQVPKSSAQMGKGHVPDLAGITKEFHGIRSKDMIGGHNIFDRSVGLSTSEKDMIGGHNIFDRSVGLSTSEKDSQPSQNMLELFRKVDQSRYHGTARHVNSSEHNLSSEMHVPDCSDGSLGDLQRSQSSTSQGFGLQLGPPSLMSPLPVSRSQLQDHQMVSARRLGLTNNSENESLDRLTDEICNGPQTGQSAEGCMSNKASLGQHSDAASSHKRVKAPQTTGREKRSTKDKFSQNVLCGKVDRAQTTNGPHKEFHANPTTSEIDLKTFGSSLKPNNFCQNYSSTNQMRAIRNTDNDPCNRITKRRKVSDNVPSKDVLASCQNEAQSSAPSNTMTSVKAEHSHISPQMAPSWFDRHGTFKNEQLLPERVGTVKSAEQPFTVERLSGTNSASDTSQVGAVWKNPAPPSVALEQSSSLLPMDAGIQHLVGLRPKKRSLTTAGLHPWFVEVSGSFKNLQGICTGAVEWSTATNRAMEKVDDDGDVTEYVPRSKRRLIFTTLLMQQLFRAPLESILSADANSIYKSVVYYVARLALGDACNLVSFARSYSSISASGANCLSDQSNESERIDDHRLLEAIEDFMGKARKLEDSFSRLDKISSVVDLKVEFEDLERFSVINHFARFHGRMHADGAETSSTIFPRRYVTAVALPGNLPDRVQCLSL